MHLKNPLHIEFDTKRIFGLDILRAFAIIFVVIGHGIIFFPETLSKIISRYFVLDGVSIFFVLSGYLIGLILLKILSKQKPNFKVLLDFWIRRWFRTLPNYFLILIILILLTFFFTTGFDFSVIKCYLLFLQNFKSPNPNFFPEAWSLCVEEWFYLIVPFLIVFSFIIFRLPPKKTILLVALSIIAFSFGIRLYRCEHYNSFSISVWDSIFRKQVVTRLDSIMFGIVGAYVSFFYNSFWKKYKTHFFILGMFLLLSAQTPLDFHLVSGKFYMYVLSFTRSAIATLFLLPFLSELKTGHGFFYKSFTYISLISYSMYLLNYSIILKFIMKPLFGLKPLTLYEMIEANLLFFSLSIILPALIYKYFELPFMNLREKIKVRSGKNSD